MPDKKEKQKLEKFAQGYIKPDPGRIVDNKILALIVDEAMAWVKGPEVLEMGMGDDAWTAKLIKKFGHSNVVDASEKVLLKARRKYGRKINAYSAFFEDFEPEKKYDTVICSYVLEHVEDPVEVLAKTATWVKPNGHILAIVPHADSYHRRLAVAMGLQKKTEEVGQTDKKIGHRRVYTMKKMEKDLAEAGLKVTRKMGLFAKFLPQSMMVGWSDKLIKGYLELGKSLPMEYMASIVYDCVPAKKAK